MTCKVNADTTNGLKLTSDTSGEIDLQTNGTTKVHMDSSGNVGIGTSSPNAKLHIHGGDQATANIDTSSDIVLNVAGTGASPNNGGSVVFSANDGAWKFAAIKGLVTSGNNNTTGDLAFSVRNATTDSTLTEAMRIDSSGNFLVGTTIGNDVFGTRQGQQIRSNGGTGFIRDSGTPLFLSRRGNNGDILTFRRDTTTVGEVSVGTSSTSYNTSSDYRLKENVSYDFDATTRLKQLKPARFNFIADADTTVDGFIAHEVSDIVPEAITGEKDAVDDNGDAIYQGIDQSKLVPLLVKTIQELEERITALENN
jgi:hypothetical protein